MAARNPDLAKQGYRCFAGPYSSNETWMMEAVVADAREANKETQISHTISGAWVWQRSKRP
jgi:hypothetical protein